MERDTALAAQKLDTLSDTFSTGMTDLKDVLRTRDEEARESRTQEREDAKTEGAANREQSRWFWGKVFAIVTSLLTVGGAGGGVWYAYAQPSAEAPAVVPAPAPVAVPNLEAGDP